MSTQVRFTAGLVALALVGCSGGQSAPLPGTGEIGGAAPAAAGTHRRKSTLIIRVRIPARRRHSRTPHYISPVTKSMTVAFSGPSTFTQVINLTPSDPRCSGSPLVCSIAVALPVGGYSATVNTYDMAPVGGTIPIGAKLLATASNVPFSVTSGIANTLGVTLDGVPASFVIFALPSGQAGTPLGETSFPINVRDAGNYTIVGTYANPVTLSDSLNGTAIKLATFGIDTPPAGELLSSSDVATLSYTGASIGPVTISATAAGATTGKAVFAPLPAVFVADYGNSAVKEIPPGCATTACVTTLGGGFSDPDGVAADGSGNVFVADTFHNAVKEIPPGCIDAGCVTAPGGGFTTPTGVAVDGSGNIYVADYGHNAVKEIPPGCFAAGCVTTLGGGFNTPGGVAVDASGNVFVADTGNNAIKAIVPGCFAPICVVPLGGGFNAPFGVAVDATGDVFVADTGNSAVKELQYSCATGACVTTLGGGFNKPDGVSVDGSGNVSVGDTSNSAIKQIPPGCVVAGCVITLGGGFSTPVGVAVQ